MPFVRDYTDIFGVYRANTYWTAGAPMNLDFFAKTGTFQMLGWASFEDFQNNAMQLPESPLQYVINDPNVFEFYLGTAFRVDNRPFINRLEFICLFPDAQVPGFPDAPNFFTSSIAVSALRPITAFTIFDNTSVMLRFEGPVIVFGIGIDPAGFTVKKNGVSQTISAASIISDDTFIQFTIPAFGAGDVLSVSYDFRTGGNVSEVSQPLPVMDIIDYPVRNDLGRAFYFLLKENSGHVVSL